MLKLQGKRIFIVEDNITNLAVFATTLRQQGATVIQNAWNVGTADVLEQKLPIDVILLDINLRRGISGYDVFDEIKANPQLVHIPVVAVTSLDPETEIPKAQGKGFSGFISKPISLVNFPAQIAGVIAGEAVWVVSW